MKKLLSLITFIVLFLNSYTVPAQIDFTKNWKGVYRFHTPIKMISCDVNGKKEKEIRVSYASQLFKIVDTIQKDVIIIINDYDSGAYMYEYTFNGTPEEYAQLQKHEKKNSTFYKNDKQYYFRISQIDLLACAIKHERTKGSFSIGVINYPFKLRIQKGKIDFSGAFNFGAALGYTIPHTTRTKWSNSALIGFSLSNINLDTGSVNLNKDKLQSVNNFTGISFAVGYVLAYDKAQLGLFVGMDMITSLNQKQFDWIYNKKPWVSLGIGFSIFSPQSNDLTPKENTKNSM